MPVMDEFREERKQIKNQPFKKKLGYFWDYYKWYLIGGILVLILLGNLVKNYMDKKDYVLFGIVVNGFANEDEKAFLNDFYEYADIDPTRYEVNLNPGFGTAQTNEGKLNTTQFIMTHLSGKKLDLAVADLDSYEEYAYEGLFLDLREVLSGETYRRLEEEGRVFYVDRKLLRELEELRASRDTTALDAVVYPDGSKPEEMEEAIPVGVNVREIEKWDKAYYFAFDQAFLGVFANTTRSEMCGKFIEFLLAE